MPGERTIRVSDLPHGAAELSHFYTGTLYRCPGRVVFATYVSVAVEIADRALVCLSELAACKTPCASERKLRHRSIAQIKFGRALAVLRLARG